MSQIASSSSTASPFVTNLNQVTQDLQSGNLSAARQDYVTLSEDAQTGATSSTATTSASGISTALLSDITSSSSSSTAFTSDINQLGTDLQNDDLSSAQGDLLALDSTALNSASSASSDIRSSSASATTAARSVSQADVAALIYMISVADPGTTFLALNPFGAGEGSKSTCWFCIRLR